MRTLAKDLNERFPNIEDFAQALARAYISQEHSSALDKQPIQNRKETSPQQAVARLSNPFHPSFGNCVPAIVTSNGTRVIEPSPHPLDTPATTPAAMLQKQESVVMSAHDLSASKSHNESFVSLSAPSSSHSIAVSQQDVHPSFPEDAPRPVFPIQVQEVQAVPPAEEPLPQKGQRFSRRTIATGLIGLAILGGSGIWYLYDQHHPSSQVFTSGKTNDSSSPNGTRTQNATDASKTTQTMTSPSSNTSPGQRATPSRSTQSTAAVQPTTAYTDQLIPLTVRIDTGLLPAQVQYNSSSDVTVITSKPSIPVVLQITYSIGGSETLGPQTTDRNGKTIFVWNVSGLGLLGTLTSLIATLQATATDTDGQKVDSNAVQVTLLL